MSNAPPRRLKKKYKYYIASFIAAVAGFFLAGSYLSNSAKKAPPVAPVRPPIEKPYSSNIAASGIIEAYGGDFGVLPVVAGKVAKVWAQEGRTVKKGAPLYRLDTQQAEANAHILLAELAVRQAHLNLLNTKPRSENIAPLRAAVLQADSNYRNLSAQLNRLQTIEDARAISQDELNRKRYEVEAAQYALQEAKAEVRRAELGTWRPEVLKAKAEYDVIKAQLAQAQLMIKLATVYAPRAGLVLKVNIHPGEYITPSDSQAPILLGEVAKLQIRVDVDEVNASKIRPKMEATAYVKGDSSLQIPLQFQKIEPMMVPKKNLTGQSDERIDERVLQIIYTFKPADFPVYPGEQLNVFINPEA